MNRTWKVVAALLVLTLVVVGGLHLAHSWRTQLNVAQPALHATAAARAKILAAAPLHALNFEPNVGQTDQQVKFLSRGQGYTLFLTRDGAVLSLRKAGSVKSRSQLNAGDPVANSEKDQPAPTVLRMQLVGANPQPKVTGGNELPGKSNYMIGRDPSKWRSNVSSYSKVHYRDIYPGVDLIYYGNQGQLEHDFIVKPGSDPKSVKLAFEGADDLALDAQGNLQVRANGDEVSVHAPVIYQWSQGHKHAIAGHFVLEGKKQVGFEVASYDTREPLVIDPVLVYSTYLGGAGDDFGTGIAIDSAGNAYIVGQTVSANYPVTGGAFQSVNKSTVDNAFVSKLNATGTALVYSTYIGGTGDDEGIGIAVDSSGSAYITGDTSSTDFPITSSAFQKKIGDSSSDAFVTKLSANGSSLTYSTYLGGNGYDIGFDVAVDASGNAYVAGQTFSSNFPVSSTAAQKTYGGLSEAFVTKVNAGGTALTYSTYWGGSNGDEQARAIVVDSAGDAYITGETTATNYPTTPSPIQGTYGGGSYDCIVAKFNPTGSAALYSTYLGGNDLDQGRGIAIDSAGDAYVTGQTYSLNFPIAGNPFQKTYGGGLADGFIFKVNPTGSALLFSGYFGGNGEDQGDHGMAVDSSGNIYIAGFTKSTNFPVAGGPIQSTFQGGAYDAIIMKLTTDGSQLVYSTYLGGNFDDSGRAIAVDSSGNAYVVGYTNSTTFPTTPGAFQTQNGGGYDSFIVKVSQSAAVASLSVPNLTFATQVVATTSAAQTVTLTNTGNLALSVTGISLTGTNKGDFAQTNTCGTSVAVNASCNINVTFKPTAVGARTASVSIADNATGSPQTVALTGIGQSASAVATLSTTSLAFGLEDVGVASPPLNVLLTDTGAATLSITSVSITGTNSTDFAQTKTCGTTLASGASCTISVTFKPTAASARSATLSIADNATGSPQTVALTGTGSTTAAPVVSFSAATLTFPSQTVNSTSVAQSVTLTNAGNTALSISSIAVTGTNSTNFAQTNTCGTAVLVGANCAISVTFTPTATGVRSAAITLTDNAANSPQSITLTGTGTASQSGQFNHVFVVVEASQNYANVVGNTSMPYLNGLISQYGLATTYYADAHPSISDYFMLTTGQVVTTNNALPNTNVDNIVRELIAAGKTWKVYAEDLPSVGYMGGDTAEYIQHHNPFVYFTDVQNSTAQQKNIVPFTQFATDLANNALPQYVFIIPNDIDDSDTGSRGGSDTWLQTNIDPLVKSAGVLNNSLLIVTYDQSSTDNTNGGGQVATVLVGPTVKTGYKSTTLYQHESVLRLMAKSLGLTTLPGAAATAPDMTEFFNAAPSVTLSSTGLTFAGQALNTTSAAQAVTLTNSGTSPLSITGIALGGTNSTEFSQTNTCGTSVAAAANCTISVTFKPTAAGTRSASITITDNANGSPQTITLTGVGNGPIASLAPASLTFASQVWETASAAQVVTLTNLGNTALAITSVALTGTNLTDYAQTNTCGTSVAAAGTCTISVTFTPMAVGTRTASVTITDGAAGSPHSFTLTGTGTGPTINLAPATLTFASQQLNTTSAAQVITLTNQGNAALPITGITLTGTNITDFAETTTCPASVAVAGTCTISLTFKPTAAGTRTAAVSIADGATGSPHTVALTGTGTGPGVSLSAAALTFANQESGTTGAAQTVTLTNAGNAALAITSIAVTGNNLTDFAQTNTCSTSVPGPGTCTINVTFTPTATGTRTAAVTITDGAAGSPHSFTLSGTATSGVVSLAPTGLTFAAQPLNTASAAQPVTLTNTGTAPLSITGIVLGGTNAGDYSQTNTCVSPIAPAGGSCIINVTFTPTAIGTRTASVSITDSAAGSPHSIALTGVGSGATVGLAPTSLTFASRTWNTTSAAQTVTLSNAGNAALAITSVAVTGTNPTDFAQTNTCGTSVAGPGTCTISVTFTPTATGARSASVTITDSAPGSPHSFALTGTGSGPTINLSPTSLTFAGQPLNTTSTAQVVTVSNQGTAALSITSVAITGTNSADFAQTKTCGTSLAAGANCTISVTFKPTAAGTRTAAVSITDGATGSPHTVPLTGTGGGITLSPTALTFTAQESGTTSAAQTVTLTNPGSVAVNLSNIAVTGANLSDFAQTNTCVTPIAAAGTCTFSVTFTPTATGTRTAAVTITDDSAGSPHSFTLTGTGTSGVISLAPSSLTFVAQPLNTASAAQPVTLTNTGTAPLSITGIVLGGTNAGDYSQTNTCVSPIAPAGGSCIINVTFTPTAAGTRTASVSITDSAAGSPHSIALTGVGSGATVGLAPTSLTFASQVLNTTSATQTVTLTNAGNAALAITSVAVTGTNPTDFAQTDTCGTSVAGPGTCTISVAFTPTATGTRSASVTITDSATGSPHSFALTGTGITSQPLAIDVTTSKDQGSASGTAVSPAFSTKSANELLLAFVSADNVLSSATTVSNMSGGGLTWTLVQRTNVQKGTAEIWRAFATTAVTNVTVTATLSQSVASSITVMSFTGVNTTGTNGSGAIGATGTGNANPGAPTASLVTTKANSLVIGVGTDWDTATARTPGANQVVVHQYLTPLGDTYWVQQVSTASAPAGTAVTINDTAPTGDMYNLSICEIVPAG